MGHPDTDEPMGITHGFCLPTINLQILVWNFLPTSIMTPTRFPVLDSDLQMTENPIQICLSRKKKSLVWELQNVRLELTSDML